MCIIIDAQIICGVYKELVLHIDSGLTDNPVQIVHSINKKRPIFVDQTGHIEHEWRNSVSREWFDAWYGTLLINGKIMIIPCYMPHQMRTLLQGAGFPINSRDLHYVKTANAVKEKFGKSIILTEDIEKSAGGDRRISIILTGKGTVLRILRKHSIHVCCVQKANEYYQSA